MTYDAAGNTTYDGSHYYFYDAENRLIQVDGSANYCSSNTGTAATACYTYDALGRRVRASGVILDTCDSTGLRDYVYDLSGRWVVRLAANQSPCRYEIYAGDRHLGSQLGHFAFSHTDWIGTERAQIFYASVSNRANDHHMTSLPFGDGLSGNYYEGNYSSTMHFTGKERDYESGLDNFGARYLSSSMGRFMSPDDGTDQDPAGPQSWNLYSYVRNNPLNAVDPDGHDCVYLDNSGGTNPYGPGGASIDHNSNREECDRSGGNWANGTVESLSWVQTLPNDDAVHIWSHYKDVIGETWAGPGYSNGDANANLIPLLPEREENAWIAYAFAMGLLAHTPGVGPEGDEALAAQMARYRGILQTAARNKGNFSLGEASASEAAELGSAFVGPGARTTGNGALLSENGLRQYRPPVNKSYGGTWANFETRSIPSGEWQSNGHLEIK